MKIIVEVHYAFKYWVRNGMIHKRMCIEIFQFSVQLVCW